MRYSIFFASALAANAAAMPHLDERAVKTVVKTEVAYQTVRVVVTVTRSRSSATSLRLTSSAAPTTLSSVRQPSGIGAPIGASLTSSSSLIPSVARSSSVPGVVVPSSSVAVPTSIRASASSVVPSPSAAAPGQYYQAHISGPSQALLSSGVDYQNAVLYHHNAARANHNAAPLVWDTTAEANARIAAEKCTFAHYLPPGVSEGQNLFTVSGTAFNVTAGITESWYKSEFPPMVPYFGQPSIPDAVFHNVGHLTQVLWKGTTGVGCVSLDCGANMIVNGQKSQLNKFTVCNYSPAGNIATLYAANVGSPIQTTNLGSWSD